MLTAATLYNLPNSVSLHWSVLLTLNCFYCKMLIQVQLIISTPTFHLYPWRVLNENYNVHFYYCYLQVIYGTVNFYNCFVKHESCFKILPFTITSATDSDSPASFLARQTYLPASAAVIPWNYNRKT